MYSMHNYSFRLAGNSDIPEIVAVYRGILGTPGCTWDTEYPSGETAREDIAGNSLYILKEADAIIAVASAGAFGELGHLRWEPKNPCELARIGVIPAMQGRGVGTVMLRKVMGEMKSKGFDGIRMLVSKTNPAALALYEKNGFQRCGEAFLYDIDFYCYQIVFADEGTFACL
jgi:ribosomal protein S18 acetylase RimI-like enzyme